MIHSTHTKKDLIEIIEVFEFDIEDYQDYSKSELSKTLWEYINNININAGNILQSTDWMVIREAEGGTAVPSSITTQRAAVRTKANEMCTALENAADLDALITLLTYVNTGTVEAPIIERPLGELPEVN